MHVLDAADYKKAIAIPHSSSSFCAYIIYWYRRTTQNEFIVYILMTMVNVH